MDVKLSMITIFAQSMEISGCTRVVTTDRTGNLTHKSYHISDIGILIPTCRPLRRPSLCLESSDSATHLSFAEVLVRANLMDLCQPKGIMV